MTIRPQATLLALTAILIPTLAVAQNQNQRPVQQAPAPAMGTNIALIDVSYVFKNHNGFKQRAEMIKKEVKDYDGRVAEQKKALTEKREGLKDYKVGSPDFERLEADIAREAANLEVEARIKRNDILEKEATLYYETYVHMTQVVAAFCERHNIGLVLRYDSEDIDPDDRASVFRGVNRAVIYQQEINITEDILQILNAPQQAARPQPNRPKNK